MNRQTPFDFYVTKVENAVFHGGHHEEHQKMRHLRDGIRCEQQELRQRAADVLRPSMQTGGEQPASLAAPQSTEDGGGIAPVMRGVRGSIHYGPDTFGCADLFGQMQRSADERDAEAAICAAFRTRQTRMCNLWSGVHAEQIRRRKNEILFSGMRKNCDGQALRRSRHKTIQPSPQRFGVEARQETGHRARWREVSGLRCRVQAARSPRILQDRG